MASGEAARPIVDELCVPLTRPPPVMGVQYEYFAINGLIVTILFIATSRFASFLLVLPLHFVGAYLCARDPYFLKILETLANHKRAIANLQFWGARSYGP